MENMNYHLHVPGRYCLYLSTRDSLLKGHVVPEIRTMKQWALKKSHLQGNRPSQTKVQ